MAIDQNERHAIALFSFSPFSTFVLIPASEDPCRRHSTRRIFSLPMRLLLLSICIPLRMAHASVRDTRFMAIKMASSPSPVAVRFPSSHWCPRRTKEKRTSPSTMQGLQLQKNSKEHEPRKRGRERETLDFVALCGERVSNLLCDPFAPSACASHRLSLGNMSSRGLMDGQHPSLSVVCVCVCVARSGRKLELEQEREKVQFRPGTSHVLFFIRPLGLTFTRRHKARERESCNCFDGCFIYTLGEHKIAVFLWELTWHFTRTNDPSLDGSG